MSLVPSSSLAARGHTRRHNHLIETRIIINVHIDVVDKNPQVAIITHTQQAAVYSSHFGRI